MIDLLREHGGEHIQVFGGGGGVIVPDEIRELQAYGVARIYSPEDGQRMGLAGMITDMVQRCDIDLTRYAPLRSTPWSRRPPRAGATDHRARERQADPELVSALHAQANRGHAGAGHHRHGRRGQVVADRRTDPPLPPGPGRRAAIAVISIDPSRRKSGGALLGDRIRMNAINHPNIFMRSLATREAGSEISQALPDVIAACKAARFDLVIVETSGIGQGDAAIVPHVDLSLYVMTPEFGAASQLEKIDMLDFADFVAINKFDRKGAQDALRDVAKQVQRNREQWHSRAEDMPVFGTQASRFNDDGVTAVPGTGAGAGARGLA
jgi:methylmalonyl-CoA mutase